MSGDGEPRVYAAALGRLPHGLLPAGARQAWLEKATWKQDSGTAAATPEAWFDRANELSAQAPRAYGPTVNRSPPSLPLPAGGALVGHSGVVWGVGAGVATAAAIDDD